MKNERVRLVCLADVKPAPRADVYSKKRLVWLSGKRRPTVNMNTGTRGYTYWFDVPTSPADALRMATHVMTKTWFTPEHLWQLLVCYSAARVECCYHHHDPAPEQRATASRIAEGRRYRR